MRRADRRPFRALCVPDVFTVDLSSSSSYFRSWEDEDTGSVIALSRAEHSVDGVQQFAGHGDQRLAFLFASRQQAFAESSQMRFVSAGHQRWLVLSEVEGHPAGVLAFLCDLYALSSAFSVLSHGFFFSVTSVRFPLCSLC